MSLLCTKLLDSDSYSSLWSLRPCVIWPVDLANATLPPPPPPRGRVPRTSGPLHLPFLLPRSCSPDFLLIGSSLSRSSGRPSCPPLRRGLGLPHVPDHTPLLCFVFLHSVIHHSETCFLQVWVPPRVGRSGGQGLVCLLSCYIPVPRTVQGTEVLSKYLWNECKKIHARKNRRLGQMMAIFRKSAAELRPEKLAV